MLFFRHSAQNSLDNRQVNCARFAHSDEKIDGASAALSLCGIALNKETGFRFIGQYDISVDDLLNGTSSISKLEKAEKFLKEFLSDGTPKTQKIIQQHAGYRDIGNRTLNDAKKNLNIKSFKKKNAWFWQLPE